MDVVSAASDLRKLLVAHDNSHTQQSALGMYLSPCCYYCVHYYFVYMRLNQNIAMKSRQVYNT